MANKTQEARLEAAKRLACVVLTLDNAKSVSRESALSTTGCIIIMNIEHEELVYYKKLY